MTGPVRGYVLFVAFPPEPERVSRERLAAHRERQDLLLRHSEGATFEMVPLIDKSERLAALEAIRRAAARLLARRRALDAPLVIDQRTRTITHGGERIHITTRGWEVLDLLLDAGGATVNATTIGRLWAPSRVAADNARLFIYRLRRWLGPNLDLIRTDRRGTSGWYVALPVGVVLIPKEAAA